MSSPPAPSAEKYWNAAAPYVRPGRGVDHPCRLEAGVILEHMEPMGVERVPRRDRVDALADATRAELPEADGVLIQLVKRIGLLDHHLTEATETALAGGGLTYAEFDILMTLRRAGVPHRLRPRELSRASLLSSGGTSNIVQRLVAVGLVDREPDPDDARSTWVRLTAEGVRTTEAMAGATGAAHAAVLRDLPDETARALVDLLRETLLAVEGEPAR